MTPADGLWARITAFDNLLLAWRRARRGKRDRPAVARFALDLEGNLLRLQRELLAGAYRPAGYRQFTVYERKPRLISAAPFRDRVLHHALMNVAEPVIDSQLLDDCYACRAGKGTHRAVQRYQQWARRFAYVLHVDVAQYFPSIDHAIVKGQLARVFAEHEVLDLFARLIDSAPPGAAATHLFGGDDLITLMTRRRGLPIGNLTSQCLANLYLCDLDHRLRGDFGARAYLRYVDDLVVLGDDKVWLWRIRDAIEAQLGGLRLTLNPRKTRLAPVSDGIDLLGYRVWPHRVRLRRDNGYRYRRRLRGLARAFRRGAIDLPAVRASVAAWVGHTRHADSEGLRRRILGEVRFVRDGR